ncbi:MAG: amidohydrolase [Pedosphaera sp.]|nr:amidohydrolase [Pedosphaera sp.]MSU42506.1 amidohydrolase [Pedosphaera sp.]
MRIDAHQHFWRYNAAQYSWINQRMNVLKRDYLPDDLARVQTPLGFEGSIAVQARQDIDEARWLLELAQAHPRIMGVVGWVDLQSAALDAQLEELAAHPQFVGVRHVVQDEPDDRFMLRPEFLRGLSKLRQHDLTYDLLVFPRQLPAAIEVVRRMPDQPFVLDHIAKPAIKEQRMEPWATLIRELAALPNVHCKISGMVTEANWTDWTAADFQPYMDVVFDAFGPERLMIGSDWPVCRLAGEYDRVMDLATDYIRARAPQSLNAFLGDNARAFYLGTTHPAAGN